MSNTTTTSLIHVFTRLLFIAMGIALLCLPAGCPPRPDKISRGGIGPTEALQSKDITDISLIMLEEAGLRHAWPAVRLPLGEDRTIKRIFYHNGRLYTLTDHNQLFALDGNNGNILWSQQLPAPLAICSAVQYYQDNLLFIISDTFLQVRETNGEILEERKLDYSISTNAARTGNLLFFGSNNRRFYGLSLEKGITLWQNLCSAKPVGVVTVNGNMVYFVTEDHMLYVSLNNKRQLIWRHQAFGDLPGVVVDQDQCFLPSDDTMLYCFDAATGKQHWKYPAGGGLRELPVLTKSAVYQHVDQKSLLCLERQSNSENGQLRWELNRGRCLLAENGTISYCLTMDDVLTLKDNLTGGTPLSFYVPHVDLYASNNENALIFLASENGTILALKPK
ncbi:MAG: hypothetical protein AMJ79_14610 [Phycisphaerae bacterium SM23_30]|nr:MAG: hypothetical protein AMJ79_14610 [Phycisphaerae bacterium SM23_30]